MRTKSNSLETISPNETDSCSPDVYFINLHKKNSENLQKEIIIMQCFADFQFSSVTHSYLTLCDPMDWSMPGLPVHHQLPEFTQTHVHWVGDNIQPSQLPSSPSPPAFKLSQYQGLCQWVSPLHQGAKVLEFQLQHQSFQWIFRDDFL